jgi:hypothetical protein
LRQTFVLLPVVLALTLNVRLFARLDCIRCIAPQRRLPLCACVSPFGRVSVFPIVVCFSRRPRRKLYALCVWFLALRFIIGIS